MFVSVASVLNGHLGHQFSHAMVLDTYDRARDVLIFKNTYDDPQNGQPKKVEILRTDPNVPEELFFVHIEIQDMDNLPSQEEREENKKAEIEMKKQMDSEAGCENPSKKIRTVKFHF